MINNRIFNDDNSGLTRNLRRQIGQEKNKNSAQSIVYNDGRRGIGFIDVRIICNIY